MSKGSLSKHCKVPCPHSLQGWHTAPPGTSSDRGLLSVPVAEMEMPPTPTACPSQGALSACGMGWSPPSSKGRAEYPREEEVCSPALRGPMSRWWQHRWSVTWEKVKLLSCP